MRLIDADELDEWLSKTIRTARGVGINPLAAMVLQEHVREMPAVEPKRGKWIREVGKYYQVRRCDQCGHVTVEQVRNYCPRCGAKMEE